LQVPSDTLRKAFWLHHSEWQKRASSNEDLNVAGVQQAVAQVYSDAGVPPPERLVWLDSPLAGSVAASIFARTCENLFIKLWNKPVDRMTQKLWSVAKEAGSTEVFQYIDLQIKASPLDVAKNIVVPIRTQIARQLGIRFSHQSDPYTTQQVFSEDTWAYILARIEQQLNQEDFDVLSQIVFDKQFAAACANQSQYCGLGGQDGDNLELLSFAGLMGMDLPEVRGLISLSRQTNWFWLFDKVCIVTYRPQMLLTDMQGRLHNDFGPAIEYNDGWCIWARKGDFIPERVIRFGDRKNLLDIEREQNIEIRRHLIEIYGVERYLKDAEAVRIHQDEYGTLYRKDFLLDEPLKMVKVMNATPEPDGSVNWYYLRVPPDMETAKAAVAWTFFMTEDEYKPDIET
jgi:hypothetical protein